MLVKAATGNNLRSLCDVTVMLVIPHFSNTLDINMKQDIHITYTDEYGKRNKTLQMFGWENIFKHKLFTMDKSLIVIILMASPSSIFDDVIDIHIYVRWQFAMYVALNIRIFQIKHALAWRCGRLQFHITSVSATFNDTKIIISLYS